MFGVTGVRVLAVERDPLGLTLTVEFSPSHTTAVSIWCTTRRSGTGGCGCAGTSGSGAARSCFCLVVTFTETRQMAAPRALLTRRTVVSLLRLVGLPNDVVIHDGLALDRLHARDFL